MIDTTKLMEAHAKVVDLVHREAAAREENVAMRASAAKAQDEIDAIAADLIAAASPVEAVGIAAVAQAIVEPVPALDIEPVQPMTSIDAALAAMAANAPK